MGEAVVISELWPVASQSYVELRAGGVARVLQQACMAFAGPPLSISDLAEHVKIGRRDCLGLTP